MEFQRVMDHIKAMYPCKEEPALLPGDILQSAAAILSSGEYADCSESFKEELFAYFKKYCAALIEKRALFGLSTDMDSTAQSAASVDDPLAAAAVDKLHRLSQSQLIHFLRKCLQKYRKAKCEPGNICHLSCFD